MGRVRVLFYEMVCIILLFTALKSYTIHRHEFGTFKSFFFFFFFLNSVSINDQTCCCLVLKSLPEKAFLNVLGRARAASKHLVTPPPCFYLRSCVQKQWYARETGGLIITARVNIVLESSIAVSERGFVQGVFHLQARDRVERSRQRLFNTTQGL